MGGRGGGWDSATAAVREEGDVGRGDDIDGVIDETLEEIGSVSRCEYSSG